MQILCFDLDAAAESKLKCVNVVCVFFPQRLSAERNTSDSDSVGVSTGENCRENGETETNMHTLKSLLQPFHFYWVIFAVLASYNTLHNFDI